MGDIAALTDKSLIERTIWYSDNLPTTVTTTTAADKLARYTLYLQTAIARFWMAAEFAWTLRTKALAAISSTGETSLPLNFLEVTTAGNLIDTATGYVFKSTEFQNINKINAQLSTAGKACFYAIGKGTDETVSRYLYVPKLWSGTATLNLTYKKIPPAVDTSDDTKCALKEIPTVYHYTYFVPLLRFRSFEDKGDAKAGIWLQQAQEGLADALRAERIGIQKDTIQRPGGAGIVKLQF